MLSVKGPCRAKAAMPLAYIFGAHHCVCACSSERKGYVLIRCLAKRNVRVEASRLNAWETCDRRGLISRQFSYENDVRALNRLIWSQVTLEKSSAGRRGSTLDCIPFEYPSGP